MPRPLHEPAADRAGSRHRGLPLGTGQVSKQARRLSLGLEPSCFRWLLASNIAVALDATVALFWSDEARAAAKWLLEALADALEETDTDQHLQHHPH
jgi:hypothetical protein